MSLHVCKPCSICIINIALGSGLLIFSILLFHLVENLFIIPVGFNLVQGSVNFWVQYNLAGLGGFRIISAFFALFSIRYETPSLLLWAYIPMLTFEFLYSLFLWTQFIAFPPMDNRFELLAGPISLLTLCDVMTAIVYNNPLYFFPNKSILDSGCDEENLTQSLLGRPHGREIPERRNLMISDVRMDHRNV